MRKRENEIKREGERAFGGVATHLGGQHGSGRCRTSRGRARTYRRRGRSCRRGARARRRTRGRRS
ncbi:unnamed protein product [Spirodela intermedia]|uniref:Uncharacterized protein n=1 Tax=Spirodela intermedia TaxID=51605 RepID=A0A7I8KDG8_SPIIN|nr:unnamed protein product [Spirodela intermedia]